MFFHFAGRNFDTPTVESAISWREQLLVSLFAHLAVFLLVALVPKLPFVQEAAERRAELVELAEVQRQALLQNQEQNDGTFVFVAPRVDTEADETPNLDAFLSDRDRVAESPLRTLDPENSLPIADGNALEFVEIDDPSDGRDALADADTDNTESENPGAEDVLFADARTLADDFPEESPLADSSLLVPGSRSRDTDESEELLDVQADGLLGQIRETLNRSVRQQSFGNVSGDTGLYGPEIQFDTKGVEFGPWIRRFVAQIRRNWFIPYSVLANHGNVVLTFNVHRDGSLTELNVVRPSGIDSFNRSASNALRMSNPTQPLPVEYPDEQAFFSVTFYFNEIPPGRTF